MVIYIKFNNIKYYKKNKNLRPTPASFGLARWTERFWSKSVFGSNPRLCRERWHWTHALWSRTQPTIFSSGTPPQIRWGCLPRAVLNARYLSSAKYSWNVPTPCEIPLQSILKSLETLWNLTTILNDKGLDSRESYKLNSRIYFQYYAHWYDLLGPSSDNLYLKKLTLKT